MRRELLAMGGMVVAMTAIPGPGEARQAGVVREHVGGLEPIKATYNDCMENPGRYDAKNFPPEPGEYSLEDYLGFEPLAPLEITLTGNCPITQTNHSSWQAGAMVCTTETKYVCGTQDSKCKCEQTAQETVCTSG